MRPIQDHWNRIVHLSDDRLNHLETDHPEMRDQLFRIAETLSHPDQVVRSLSDAQVELFYRLYLSTPVTTKYLCVVVKNLSDYNFIITAYFTDKVKRGELLWMKK